MYFTKQLSVPVFSLILFDHVIHRIQRAPTSVPRAGRWRRCSHGLVRIALDHNKFGYAPDRSPVYGMTCTVRSYAIFRTVNLGSMNFMAFWQHIRARDVDEGASASGAHHGRSSERSASRVLAVCVYTFSSLLGACECCLLIMR